MGTNNINDVQDMLKNCLSQQLSEFETLQSMYPNNDEIVLTNNKTLEQIKEFINNVSEYTPSHLDFTVNLHLNNLKLEVCINLPTMYPEKEPDVYIRCNQLNRQQETHLNTALSCYIKENHNGEVCLYTAISWVQDNIDNFIKGNSKNLPPEHAEDGKSKEDKYLRLWIYSHHIYNKKKREVILQTAKELDITGFCLPGKPGIICVEGTDTNCNEWWKRIKSMSWQKIDLRKTEELKSSKDYKFSNFEEIYFKVVGVRYCKHSNMSDFSKFLDMHSLGHAFGDLFKLE